MSLSFSLLLYVDLFAQVDKAHNVSESNEVQFGLTRRCAKAIGKT
jgi:hypothetical protein